MKLSLIRFLKKAFIVLRLHVVFNLFSGLFSNLFYLTKLSLWASKQKTSYNDFPSKWDYTKRFQLYKWVIEKEALTNDAISYLEFGVAGGHSFRWFMEQNKNAASRFYGFDTFTGLPEDWGPYKKGFFDNGSKPPAINDERGKFFQGLFQQTLPGFVQTFKSDKRNIIMMDADLYSSTLYTLTTLAPFLKKDDIIFFDEFVVPTHEFKAFLDFTESYYVNLQLIGAANNYYFAAFKVV
jgi:O-methyltransferase